MINLSLKRYLLWVALLLFLAYQFFIASFGFYFAGDTVSHLEMANWAKPGGIVTLTRLHSSTWPPLMTSVLNLLRAFPGGYFFQAKVFVIIFFSLNLIYFYLLTNEIVKDKLKSLLISTVALFGGVQVYLLRSESSEQLFILLWTMGTYYLFKFYNTNRLLYFIVSAISFSFLSLSRYVGIWVLLAFGAFSLLIFLKSKLTRKFKFSLLIVLILSFLPITAWLLNNYAESGWFFPRLDQRHLPMIEVSFVYLKQIFMDVSPVLILAFVAGQLWNFKIQKKTFGIIFILVASYYLGLFYNLSRTAAFENFPSRYTAVAYPMLSLSIFLLGNIAPKFPVINKKVILSIFGLLFLLFVFSQKEFLFSPPGQKIIGGEYSSSIQELCSLSEGKNAYLFIQLYSRNWVSQSLKYYCPMVVIEEDLQQFSLPKDGILYSPYVINDPSLEKVFQYEGEKRIYIYRIQKNFNLSLPQIRSNLDKLD